MIDTSTRNNRLVWLAVILLATLAVYARTLDYGLVNWDEPLAGVNLYQETPDAQGMTELLRPRLSGTYQPVRAVATALLAQYGAQGNWVPYHVVSLVFYLGTVVFLYLLALVLIGRAATWADKPRRSAAALTAAAVFALHPSHAEAVAWVSGHKDTFVAFFYLGSLYFYIRREYPNLSDYLLCMLFFALALGSKPSAVSLPAVLLAYDLTVRGAGDRMKAIKRLWPGYVPFFAPAVAATVFFSTTTARVGSVVPSLTDLATRLLKLLASLGFSLLKLVLPVNLCLRYPAFDISLGHPAPHLYIAVALALLAWTVRSVIRGGRAAFLLSWFVLALLPNSNLIRITIERADRYYYLSSAAFAILIGWGALELYHRTAESRRGAFRWAVLAVLLLLGAAGWNQAGYWGSPVRAWSRAFELYPEMILARLGMASSYLRTGEYDEALRYYKPLLEGNAPNLEAIKGAIYISEKRSDSQKALELARLGHRLAPTDREFMETLTRFSFMEGDTAAAAVVIGEWLEQYPDSWEGQFNLGNLHWRRGEIAEAEQVLGKVIRDYSVYPEPYMALAKIKEEQGKYAEAEEILKQGLATGRKSVEVRQQLAHVYSESGRQQEALEIYSRYEMDDLDMQGLEFMGGQYFSQGDLNRALEHFQAMAGRDSTLARACNNSAVVLEKMGRALEADSLYNRAIRLDSAYVDAWFNQGNLAFGAGNYSRAVRNYLRADSLAAGQDGSVLDALIRAQAAAGDTAAARRTYQRSTGGGRGAR